MANNGGDLPIAKFLNLLPNLSWADSDQFYPIKPTNPIHPGFLYKGRVTQDHLDSVINSSSLPLA